MRSRIPFGWVMMLVAIALSVVPAAASPAGRAEALSTCNWAQFVADVNVPDGTNVRPGLTFTKTWRLKNIGTCTWTTSYALVFSSGAQLGGPASVSMPNNVAPGQTVDVSVSLTAPNSAGHYIGYWQFKNAAGASFGIGSNANKAWWVDINVLPAESFSVAYDFAANYCSASWYSIVGSLPCPGTDGDARGFVLKADNPQLEDGSFATGSGLVLMPQNAFNGDIHGAFPAFRVQSGDRFRSVINCSYSAPDCFVTFRLDYQIGNGAINTLWSVREAYDGLFFRTDLDLSALAGQDVKFILTVLATGSATGDRALWANPIIARPGSVPPPPTVTPGPGTKTPTPQPPASSDRAQFVADVTVPDGTVFAPGAAFNKIWRLRNVGTSTWTTGYALVFDSGDKMGGPDSVNMPQTVAPGQTVDLALNLTAPGTAGSYRGYWKFQNASGVRFGLGTGGTKSWWVDIKVSGTPITVTPIPGLILRGYVRLPDGSGLQGVPICRSFAGYSGVVVATTDANGYFQSDFTFIPGDEMVTVWPSAAGYTYQPDRPNWRHYYGVEDHTVNFVATPGSATQAATPPVPCTGATATPPSGTPASPTPTPTGTPAPAGCDKAQFVADVTVPDGKVFAPGAAFLKTWRLRNVGTCTWSVLYALVYESGEKMGAADSVRMPKTVPPGSTVDVSLNMTAPNTAGTYRGYWRFQNANGVRFGVGSDATKSWWVEIKVVGKSITPTPTATSVDTTGWNSYVNDQYGFSFKIPPGSSFVNRPEYPAYIDLPFTAGTTLAEKWIYVTIGEGANPCKSPEAGLVTSSTTVTINGIQFLKELGVNGTAGHFYDITAYSTLHNNACISLTFVMRSVDPGVFTSPPPVYNKAAESAVFPIIMSTFGFFSPQPTLTSTSPSGTTPSPASTPTSTATVPAATATATASVTEGWNTYVNDKYLFSFKFPPGSSIASQSDNLGRVYLPIIAGTNLSQKWISIEVVEGADPCKSPSVGLVSSSENVTINGIPFLKEIGGEGAAGSMYDATAYSTVKGNACISLSFVMKAANLGNFPTPPPAYDKAAESAVFPVIMSTYGNQ